jgi:GDPmannose 4,6-dehydratase
MGRHRCINSANGKELINISRKFFRPTEVDLLLGDPTKAKTNLNWKQKVSFEQLVKMMVDSDVNGIS